ncbi:WxL domain-containing protein [Enterococcus faecalis]|uniref:WxL domain-containing protein n=1 Tax=Enterococcus faecalis TaxID=1351 RepID=UPI000CF21F58|nr:WxL domain-containing protein [Enterococcus faecalis]PQD45741.1 WxL domain-containing protein [Enterococcus faecalis]
MKKTVVYSLLFGTMLLGATVPAEAATVVFDSEQSIVFTPSTDGTDPVNPENPDPEKPVRPVDPTNPDGPNPGTPGPLSINYASSLDFGSNEISNKDQTYFARAQTYKNPDGSASELATANYVQVSDLRGTNAGWVLKVKQNGQFRNAETLHKELTGATVAFAEPSVRSNATDVLPPTATANIQLDAAGAETVVMQAPEKTGAGTWITLWGQAEKVTEKNQQGQQVNATITRAISLTVPGKTPKDAVQYKTTLTWLLSDVPVNNGGK